MLYYIFPLLELLFMICEMVFITKIQSKITAQGKDLQMTEVLSVLNLRKFSFFMLASVIFNIHL